MMEVFKFKTLQGRLMVFLILPVFLTIFSGGVFTFLYTRDAMIQQWNESAVLKLQRAAHYIEMRLFRPIELAGMLFQPDGIENDTASRKRIVDHLKSLAGVVRVNLSLSRPGESVRDEPDHSMPMDHAGMPMGGRMMRIHHAGLASITDPEYDTDAGHKTVKLTSSLLDFSDQVVGKLEITMSFDYLLEDIKTLGWWQSDMACIVDKAGNYMVHTNMSMTGRHVLGETGDLLEETVLERIRSKPYGTVNAADFPATMVAGFYGLERVPWTIILFAKREIILKPIIRYRNVFILGSGFIMLLILLLIRSHVGKIAFSIRKLSENAGRVAQGDYDTPVKAQTEDEIGQLIQSYNAMVKGLRERDFIRNSFGRYVDPEFAKALLKRPDAGRLGGQRREVVIMMSDIRGFTPLAEELSPEVTIKILNHYFSHMIRVIQQHHGIIVDFFGDAILVFFEPVVDGSMVDTVRNCLHCALSMQNEMALFNQEMKTELLPEIKMGIGIHSGPVIVGNIGSKTRAKYGIVGSAVNVTHRIQTKAKKDEVVISDTVYKHVEGTVKILETIRADLKGVEGAMTLYVVNHENLNNSLQLL